MIEPNTGIDLGTAAVIALGVTSVVLIGIAADARNKLVDARHRIETLTSDVKWFKAEADKFARRGRQLSAELASYKAVAAADKPSSSRHTVTRHKQPARSARVATGTDRDVSASGSSDEGMAISSLSSSSSYSSSACDSSSSSSSSSSSCDSSSSSSSSSSSCD